MDRHVGRQILESSEGGRGGHTRYVSRATSLPPPYHLALRAPERVVRALAMPYRGLAQAQRDWLARGYAMVMARIRSETLSVTLSATWTGPRALE